MFNDIEDLDEWILDNTLYLFLNILIIGLMLIFLACGSSVLYIIFKGLEYGSNKLWSVILSKYYDYKESKDDRVTEVEIGRNFTNCDSTTFFDRTTLNLETIELDSMSDMEYYSVNGSFYLQSPELSYSKGKPFPGGVKCHSTPSTLLDEPDDEGTNDLQFNYVKNDIKCIV
uniref:Orfan n=1 Tax=Parastrongyloides trichosuri TaxID=131310 RepID=A0A0N4ZSA3_PARTI